MHLYIELMTLGCFLACAGHAVWLRRREGALLFGGLLYLGFARENFVALQEILYGFAPLSLMFGRAPLIAAIIWGFSIYVAACWVERMGGGDLDAGRLSPRSLGLVAIFMVSLACFYEPFLALQQMARWEAGTRTTWGVPWISLVGYPALAVPFLLAWSSARRRLPGLRRRIPALAGMLTALALLHALGLQALKAALGW